MRIVILGDHPLAGKALRLLEGMEGMNVLAVVQSPRDTGRCNYCPVVGARTLLTSSINAAWVLEWLRALRVDVLLQVGWSEIIAPVALAAVRHPLGIHPAPLPIGKGAAVLNWAIIEGQHDWGTTLFRMVPTADDGPILDQEPFELSDADDINSAFAKADEAALKMIGRTFPRLADGTWTERKQEGPSTRYPRRTPEDGRMERDWPAEKIDRYMRALAPPYPGAYFENVPVDCSAARRIRCNAACKGDR